MGSDNRECFLIHGPYFCFQLALGIIKIGGIVVFWDRMRVTRLAVGWSRCIQWWHLW